MRNEKIKISHHRALTSSGGVLKNKICIFSPLSLIYELYCCCSGFTGQSKEGHSYKESSSIFKCWKRQNTEGEANRNGVGWVWQVKPRKVKKCSSCVYEVWITGLSHVLPGAGFCFVFCLCDKSSGGPSSRTVLPQLVNPQNITHHKSKQAAILQYNHVTAFVRV